jgi:hypothetical protein
MWLPKPQFFGSNIAKFSVERNFFLWPNTRTRPRALGQVPEPAREKFEIPVPARNPKIKKKGYPNPLDTRKIPTRHITIDDRPRETFKREKSLKWTAAVNYASSYCVLFAFVYEIDIFGILIIQKIEIFMCFR